MVLEEEFKTAIARLIKMYLVKFSPGLITADLLLMDL